MRSAYSVANDLAADRIKRDIIHKAKIKRQYAKVREREFAQQPNLQHQDAVESKDSNAEYREPPSTLKRHPDRENMINDSSSPINTRSSELSHVDNFSSGTDRKRRQKPLPFRNEILKAEKIRAEMYGREKARKEAGLQKIQRLKERERMRRAMAKARGTRTGRRKLGGESRLLLEKVRRIVGEP